MDMKDVILVGGGLLIVAVVVHGLWIAWRARRDPLRMDLVTDLPPDTGDDLVRLRAELPNGGARIVRRDDDWPEQVGLPLDEDEAPAVERPRARRAGDTGERRGDSDARQRGARMEPHLRIDADVGPAAPEAEAAGPDAATATEEPAERSGRPRVADVIMPERPVGRDASATPRRAGSRRDAERGASGAEPADPVAAENAPKGSAARALGKLAERAGLRSDAGTVERAVARSRLAAPEARKPEPVVEELIMINLLAQRNNPFTGPSLVEALRSRGLRYGDMNIFHRVDPMSRTTLYSVANVVEPGTFDVADLEQFRSPGICFFMQLPGPEHPMEVFEDMLKVAREVSSRIGGELKDERRSVLTGQTVEHYRQRISDFCRRRMSMRA